jgi:hypothetical protein
MLEGEQVANHRQPSPFITTDVARSQQSVVREAKPRTQKYSKPEPVAWQCRCFRGTARQLESTPLREQLWVIYETSKSLRSPALTGYRCLIPGRFNPEEP